MMAIDENYIQWIYHQRSSCRWKMGRLFRSRSKFRVNAENLFDVDDSDELMTILMTDDEL